MGRTRRQSADSRRLTHRARAARLAQAALTQLPASAHHKRFQLTVPFISRHLPPFDFGLAFPPCNPEVGRTTRCRTLQTPSPSPNPPSIAPMPPARRRAGVPRFQRAQLPAGKNTKRTQSGRVRKPPLQTNPNPRRPRRANPPQTNPNPLAKHRPPRAPYVRAKRTQFPPNINKTLGLQWPTRGAFGPPAGGRWLMAFLFS